MIRRCLPKWFCHLPAVMAMAFVITHTAALAHEYEHIFHQHDEPCAQHAIADHLAKAPAPLLPVLPALEPTADAPMPVGISRDSRPAPSYVARAPPTSVRIPV
jgi:hypothetical protein